MKSFKRLLGSVDTSTPSYERLVSWYHETFEWLQIFYAEINAQKENKIFLASPSFLKEFKEKRKNKAAIQEILKSERTLPLNEQKLFQTLPIFITAVFPTYELLEKSFKRAEFLDPSVQEISLPCHLLYGVNNLFNHNCYKVKEFFPESSSQLLELLEKIEKAPYHSTYEKNLKEIVEIRLMSSEEEENKSAFLFLNQTPVLKRILAKFLNQSE